MSSNIPERIAKKIPLLLVLYFALKSCIDGKAIDVSEAMRDLCSSLKIDLDIETFRSISIHALTPLAMTISTVESACSASKNELTQNKDQTHQNQNQNLKGTAQAKATAWAIFTASCSAAVLHYSTGMELGDAAIIMLSEIIINIYNIAQNSYDKLKGSAGLVAFCIFNFIANLLVAYGNQENTASENKGALIDNLLSDALPGSGMIIFWVMGEKILSLKETKDLFAFRGPMMILRFSSIAGSFQIPRDLLQSTITFLFTHFIVGGAEAFSCDKLSTLAKTNLAILTGNIMQTIFATVVGGSEKRDHFARYFIECTCCVIYLAGCAIKTTKACYNNLTGTTEQQADGTAPLLTEYERKEGDDHSQGPRLTNSQASIGSNNSIKSSSGKVLLEHDDNERHIDHREHTDETTAGCCCFGV